MSVGYIITDEILKDNEKDYQIIKDVWNNTDVEFDNFLGVLFGNLFNSSTNDGADSDPTVCIDISNDDKRRKCLKAYAKCELMSKDNKEEQVKCRVSRYKYYKALKKGFKGDFNEFVTKTEKLANAGQIISTVSQLFSTYQQNKNNQQDYSFDDRNSYYNNEEDNGKKLKNGLLIGGFLIGITVLSIFLYKKFS